MERPDEVVAFSCSVCGIELEMPADAAGEEVDCPECDAVLVVPERVSPSAGLRTTQLPSELRLQDALRTAEVHIPATHVGAEICPICGANIRPLDDDCFACGTPCDINFLNQRRRPRGIFVGEILHTSLKIFLDRLGILIPAIIFETAVALGLYGLLFWAMAIGLQWRVDWLVIGIVFAVYCTYHILHVGHYRLMLSVCRGEPVAAHRLIWPTSGTAYVGPAIKILIVSTMYWGAIFFGFLFGVVPGIVFALLAWPCGRLVVDRDGPAGLAISQAIDLTVPHWPGVLSLNAFLFAIQFSVGLIGFGIGQILAPLLVFCLILPFSSLVLTVTYLRLSDEPTAVERAAAQREEWLQTSASR